MASPAGKFIYQENDEYMVIFAEGIGITPLVFIIEKGLAANKRDTLLNSNRSKDHRPS